jgi:arylamine N-acetyltransferase
VAFGGLSSTLPVFIPPKNAINEEVSVENIAGDGKFRVIRNDSDWDYLSAQWYLKDTWTSLYKFSQRVALDCDMVVGNWYSCTGPDARWVNCLYVSRIIGEERHHVLNSEYCVRRKNGVAERSLIPSVEELLILLAEVFGISFEGIPSEEKDSLAYHMNSFFQKGPPPTFHAPSYWSST